jgi:hypothetical protein
LDIETNFVFFRHPPLLSRQRRVVGEDLVVSAPTSQPIYLPLATVTFPRALPFEEFGSHFGITYSADDG